MQGDDGHRQLMRMGSSNSADGHVRRMTSYGEQVEDGLLQCYSRCRSRAPLAWRTGVQGDDGCRGWTPPMAMGTVGDVLDVVERCVGVDDVGELWVYELG